MRARTLLLALSLALPRPAAAAGAQPPEVARIAGGTYTPLFVNGRRQVAVRTFALDRHAVTRADFLAFVTARPQWRRGRVRAAFADPGYLGAWPGELSFGGAGGARRPATQVGWFAARDY